MTELKYGHWVTNKLKPVIAIGFIYEIENTIDNKKYIGKKQLFFRQTKKPLKGFKRKRRSITNSDWEVYTGSNNQLNADIKRLGKDKFKFTILQWCLTKTDLSYAELKHIVDAQALWLPNYYNSWIYCRIRNNRK